MIISCIECQKDFDSQVIRGYCDDCIALHRSDRQRVGRCQHPGPELYLDGKFTERRCPQTVTTPDDRQVCGLCGSADLEPGYGLGSGYGIGSYTWCNGCNNFLDFMEDSGE